MRISRSGNKSKQTPSSSAEDKNAYSYVFYIHSSHVFLAWSLTKHMDTFNFVLLLVNRLIFHFHGLACNVKPLMELFNGGNCLISSAPSTYVNYSSNKLYTEDKGSIYVKVFRKKLSACYHATLS
jgi:hypothetical protein